MDAGDRWMLMDAAGKPMLAWDFNERQTDSGPAPERRLFFTEYDGLHRPLFQKLSINEEPRRSSSGLFTASRPREMPARAKQHKRKACWARCSTTTI